MIETYKQKEVRFEAVQFDGSNIVECGTFMNIKNVDTKTTGCFEIKTIGGGFKELKVGDFILKYSSSKAFEIWTEEHFFNVFEKVYGR